MSWFSTNAPQVGRGRMADAGVVPAQPMQVPAVASRGTTADSQQAPAAMDPYDQQIIDAVTRANGGNPDPAFLQEQLNYYRQRRASGEITGAGTPADDNYWIMRAGQATDPAHTTGGGMSGLPSGYSLNGGPLSSFSAPGLAAPWTQQFKARSPQEVEQDPNYQWIRDQAREGIQKSAASKGTLLTGGTLKDLAAFEQGNASNFLDKFYNRDLGEYQMNQGTFYTNQNNAYNKLSGMANQGANAASSYAANLGNLYTQGANANALTTQGNNAGWENTFGNLADLGTSLYKDYEDRKKAAAAKVPAYLSGKANTGALSSLGKPMTLQPRYQGDAIMGGDYA